MQGIVRVGLLAWALFGAACAPAEGEAAEAGDGQLFATSDLWKPDMQAPGPIDPYLAPLLYLEQGGAETRLVDLRSAEDGSVVAATGTPTVYVEEGRVPFAGDEHRQLTLHWALAPGPDGSPRRQSLRITFGRSGFPGVYELWGPDAGAPAVYVSDALEAAAAERFGVPASGLAVVDPDLAAEVEDSLRVVGTVADGPVPMGPYVYASTRAPLPTDVHCRCAPTRAGELESMHTYTLAAPLPDGAGAWVLELDLGPPDLALLQLRLPDAF